MQQYQVGTIADGPNGPMIFNGQGWVPMTAAQGGQRTQVRPADPTRPADIRKANADAAKAEADASVAAPMAQAQLINAQANAASAAKPTAAQTEAEQKAAASEKRAATIRALTGEVRRLYNQDIKGQPLERLGGLTEYIDALPNNERFTSAGNTMLPLIRPLIAQSTKEGDSNTELLIFQSYVPSANDSDKTIEQKLAMLEILIGGMVDGRAPSQSVQDLNEGRIVAPPALRNEGYVGGDERGYMGPNGWVAEPPPPSGGGGPGGMDPDQAARQGASVDAYMRGTADQWTLGGMNKIAAAANTLLPLDRLGGFDVRSVWDGSSLGDAYRHNIALQNRTDDADTAVNPVSRTLGQLTGAVASGATAAKYAPGLFTNATATLAPRAIAADAAAGSIYGANKASDRGQPVLPAAAESAAYWAGGGVAGRGVANVGGRAVSGITDPAIQNLRNAKIPLSMGQMLSRSGLGLTGLNLTGRGAKALEDVAAGTGPIGAGVMAQREAGMEAFNRAAFNEGLAPIGRTVSDIGEQGVAQARTARNAGYADALDNVNLTADLPFVSSVNDIAKRSDAIRGMEGLFRDTLQNRVGGQFDKATRSMGGRDLQAAIRGLKADAKRADANTAFMRSDQFGDAARATEGALLSLAERQNPGVSQAYSSANKANMNYEILRKAVRTGRNSDGLFTPAQLRTAADTAAERFGGRGGTPDVPFHQLTKDAQAVLPSKMPDSGSPGRITTLSLPWLVTTGGAGAENQGWAPSGTTAALAAIALGSSPLGRKIAEKGLLARPKTAQEIGKAIRKRAGLFGAAAAPVPILISN